MGLWHEHIINAFTQMFTKFAEMPNASVWCQWCMTAVPWSPMVESFMEIDNRDASNCF